MLFSPADEDECKEALIVMRIPRRDKQDMNNRRDNNKEAYWHYFPKHTKIGNNGKDTIRNPIKCMDNDKTEFSFALPNKKTKRSH